MYRQSVRQSFRQSVSLSAGQKAAVERAGWERSQKGTYTRWLNFHLAKNPEAGQVTDIETDLCDGTKLCALLEIFQGRKLTGRVWKPIVLPKDRFKAVENANIFLKEFKQAYPSVRITIDALNIANGDYTLVMGLLWQMILAVQMDVNDFGPDSETNVSPASSSSSSSSSQKGSSIEKQQRVRTIAFVKANLQEWVNERIEPYGLQISDFSDSFEDGKVFQALAASIDGQYIYEHVVTNDPRHNMAAAFARFEQLGVPALLNPDDMVGECSPDDRSVMTYLSMIHHEFKDAPMAAARRDEEDDPDVESLKVTLDGPGLRQAFLGKHNHFSVTVMDPVRDRVVPSSEDIDIEIVDEMGANVIVFPQPPSPAGGSVFSYVPCRPECPLTITINLRDTRVHSLTVPVSSAPPAIGMGFKLACRGVENPAQFGLPSSFAITGLPASLPPDEVRANLISIVQGPGSQVIVSLSAEAPASHASKRLTTQLGGAVRAATGQRYGYWTPQELGNHELFVFYAGQLQEEHFIDVVLPSEKPKADEMLVGQQATFVVTVQDPPADIRFRLIDPNGGYVDPVVTKTGADQFKIVFVPTIPGEYVIETTISGQTSLLEPVIARSVERGSVAVSQRLMPSSSQEREREPAMPAIPHQRLSQRMRSESCAALMQSFSKTGKYPATGVEVRAITDSLAQPSFKIWLEEKPLETYLGVTNSFKTFMLTPTLTTDMVRQQTFELLTRGASAEKHREAKRIVDELAYCICYGHPHNGDVDSRTRLYRAELITDVLRRLQQADRERARALDLSKKLTSMEMDLLEASYPCRLIVSVVQVESSPTSASAEKSYYYKVYYNHQVRKSSWIVASSPDLKWNFEALPFGVGEALPATQQSIRIVFRKRKTVGTIKEMYHIDIPIIGTRINTETVGWYPLKERETGGYLPQGRALVQVDYRQMGPWTCEAWQRLFYCPCPVCYLLITIWYPKQRMRTGEMMPVQVKVRDIQNDKQLTDDLAGGELELHVTRPNGTLELFPIHKNYPNPQVGLFYIDFRPKELGVYQSMLKYNDQLLQHRICYIKVKPSKRK